MMFILGFHFALVVVNYINRKERKQ